MRARRDGRRTGRDAIVLCREPRPRSGRRARLAARRIHHGPVGQCKRCRPDLCRRARCSEEGSVNAPTRINSRLDVQGQFPAIANWHYLDSAATAQKPQAVIDAITEAYARDYATVHRGVYQRSSEMTGRYEAARAAAATLIGGAPHELVFTRGATEAINLVARALPKEGRNRVLVSSLEHHSNIV